MEMLPLQGGSSGASNGGSSNGGSANGGSANGGTSGGNQGGSANPGGGGTGQGGASGSGMGGSMMGEAGSGGDVPDAGGGEEPDSGGPDPNEDTVSFSADLHQQIFVARCAGCHGGQWGSPTLATAYAAAVANAEEIAGRVEGEGGNIMPQGCGPAPGQGNCLSVAQVELIQTWVDDGTPP